MISFKTYILSENEILLEKDTYFSPHLSHLEDLAIEGGKNGFNSFLIQATNIINKLKGLKKTLYAYQLMAKMPGGIGENAHASIASYHVIKLFHRLEM